MARPTEIRTGREQLGEVSAPSGTLVVVDTGLLNLWTHDRAPLLPDDILSPETTAKANAGLDFSIDGPDAEKAGKLFDRGWHPRFLYDIPANGVLNLEATFAEHVRAHRLNAKLVPLSERVPHRRRIDLALEYGRGAGEISFHGIWAAVVSGVPQLRLLPIFGERMQTEQDCGRWHVVYVECQPGGAISRSEFAGHAMVDKSRLMFADANALGDWKQEECLDGRADFVFWGKDAAQLAALAGAKDLGDDEFGWVDLPVDEAVERGTAAEALRDQRGIKVATDFRPHSHHHQVMQQVRSSPTESGVVSVGKAKMCTFMTTWGDGIFPVYRDLDASGQLIRIRIHLGNEKIVKRQRTMEERWFGQFAKFAAVSAKVVDDGASVRWLFREETDRDDDSGWRVFAGDENEEYTDDAKNIRIVPLRELIDRDETLEAVFRAPVGAAFERERSDLPFRPVS